PDFCPHAQLLVDGQPHSAEIYEERLGGDFLVSVSPLYGLDGRLFGSVHYARDITARKRAEEAVKAERQRFNDILEMLPAYLALLTPDYHVPFANRFFRERFGEAHGRRCYEYLFGLSQPCQICETYKVLQTNAPHHWEWTGPDGRNYDVYDFPFTDVDGAPLILEMGIDITQRKQAEQMILEAEQRLRSLINSTPDIICFKDGQGRWLEANAADLELFALTGVDYRGQTDAELAALTAPLYRQAFLTAKATDEKAWQAGGISRREEVIARPDGAEKVYDVIKVPIFDAAGQRQGLVVLGRDITDRKQIEQQLVRQERLAAVGQLAAGIAHDFNNILTAILGCAELLQMSPDTPPAMRADLQVISASSWAAALLVRQLLDFSRKSIRSPQQFALDAFTKESIKFFERTIPENVRISLTVAPGDYLVEADPTQMQQVITNLVVNARDAMPAGGHLEIGLSRRELAGDEKCAVCDEPIRGDWFGLTVADSGSGIAAEVLPHIFEPFFTTKEAGEGTGLGLSQVYGIISQHAGHITVKSQVGRGTVIAIYLPPATRHKEQGAAETPSPMLAGQGETILVVEDAVAEIIKAMLEHLNYRVLTAANGREALAVYQAHRADIGLVLADMVMPDMGGEALFQALKAENPELRMVMMSGYPLGQEGVRLLEQGVVAWFEKPMSFGQLSQVVSQALSNNKKKKGRWG
ncbi:MAG: PAS domain-containing protein, partial [Chloroflexota bacterium]